MSNNQIKSFELPNPVGPPTMIHYAIVRGYGITFTGDRLPDLTALTTLERAPEIILRIADLEGLEAEHRCWHELRTHRMYGGERLTDQRPGEFEFLELEILFDPQRAFPPDIEPVGVTDLPLVKCWEWKQCPPKIVALFATFIGPNPFQMSDFGSRRDF